MAGTVFLRKLCEGLPSLKNITIPTILFYNYGETIDIDVLVEISSKIKNWDSFSHVSIKFRLNLIEQIRFVKFSPTAKCDVSIFQTGHVFTFRVERDLDCQIDAAACQVCDVSGRHVDFNQIP